MSIAERLNAFRFEVPGCESVAFADLSSGLVLCASSEGKKPQEWFDQMCAAAQEMLDGALARETSALASRSATPGAQQAIHIADGELRLFLRSETAPNEALCCVCITEVSVDLLIQRAVALLHEISTIEALR